MFEVMEERKRNLKSYIPTPGVLMKLGAASWGHWKTFYEEIAGEEGFLFAQRRECMLMAARRWMGNKRELEMEMNVSQHPRVY